MNKEIRNKLIFKPLLLMAIGICFGLFLIDFIPSQLSVISAFKKTGKTIELPAALGYGLIVALAFKPLLMLLSNLWLIHSWQKGKNPSCPVCSYPMLQRIAKRGTFSGQRFWGCVSYPKCGGKEHIG